MDTWTVVSGPRLLAYPHSVSRGTFVESSGYVHLERTAVLPEECHPGTNCVHARLALP